MVSEEEQTEKARLTKPTERKDSSLDGVLESREEAFAKKYDLRASGAAESSAGADDA